MIRYQDSDEKSRLTKKTAEGILIHDKAEDMPSLPVGRFAHMPGDKRIFALACKFPSGDEPGTVIVSCDDGATWEPTAPFGPEGEFHATDSGAFTLSCARTRAF